LFNIQTLSYNEVKTPKANNRAFVYISLVAFNVAKERQQIGSNGR